MFFLLLMQLFMFTGVEIPLYIGQKQVSNWLKTYNTVLGGAVILAILGVASLYFGLTMKEYFKPPVLTEKKHQ